MGSFVPTTTASFSIIKQIFVCSSMNDSIEQNLSTFAVEMRDMAFILSNITHESIAIIDELGRGTSAQDGLAITAAISEELVLSRAKIWFATHFIELADMFAHQPGVLTLKLKTETTIPLALRPIGPGFRRLGREAAAPGGL
jgi:DNA mismatch repair protein MSH4